MKYRIELSKEEFGIPSLGYKEIFIVPHEPYQQIERVKIETKFGFPRWVYRHDFIVQPGHDILEIKAYGDVRAEWHITVEFYNDPNREGTLYVRSTMVDGSPMRLYALVKNLIDDHKRCNPSMLQ